MFEKIKEKLMLEKERLYEESFTFKYIILPSISGFIALCMLAVAVLLLVDARGLALWSLGVFCLVIIAGVVLAILYVVTRKKEANYEIIKLQELLEAPEVSDPEVNYVLAGGNVDGIINLTFLDGGILIGENEYDYSKFVVSVATTSVDNKVIMLVFFENEEVKDEDEEISVFNLPLDNNMFSIIKKFNIKLDNPEELEFIKNNIELSVKQILKYGKVQIKRRKK